MYYLKLSGFIPEHNQKEFEQTYRLASTQIPEACLGFQIMRDVIHEGKYHFITYWAIVKSLDSFSQSELFFMMSGAFTTLGQLYENVKGEMTQHVN